MYLCFINKATIRSFARNEPVPRKKALGIDFCRVFVFPHNLLYSILNRKPHCHHQAEITAMPLVGRESQ